LWWGLVLGLAVVATVLLVRVRIALGRQQRRVIIDPSAAPARANEWSPIPSPGARD
jgi:hypothetical protein